NREFVASLIAKIEKSHRVIKTGNFIISLFLVFWCVASGAEVKVTAEANPKAVALGENVTVTVTVSDSEEFEAEEPRLPDLDGFDLLNSWDQTAVSQKLVSTPQGMQFQTNRRREFNYMLSPKALGQLSVGSFEVVVNGKAYRTQPLTVSVTKESASGGAGAPRRGGQPPDPFEDMLNAEEEMFRQLLQSRNQMLRQALPQIPDDVSIANPAFRSLPRNPNEAFFISVEVDKTEVYVGEQVTVNWYVYTRGQMETLDRLKFPSLRGFWKEIIEEVPSIQFMEEIVNGVPYKKALLASHALFPIKAGTATIDEFKIKSRIRTINPGFGGFGKAFEYTKSSAAVPVKVKPLPLEGRSADFTGAVGRFEVNAVIEGQGKHPVNQPFTMRVRFEGAGNAKTIDLPKMDLPAGVEIFDTKSESKFFKNGRSYKQFEVLMLPRQIGPLTLPAMKVTMFDPESGQYYQRETNPLMIEIVDNPNAPVSAANRLALNKKKADTKKEIELPLPYVHAHQAQVPWSVPIWMWWVLYGSSVAFGLAQTARYKNWFAKRDTLERQLAKRLKSAQNAMNKNNYRQYSVDMMNAFYLVLGQVSEESSALSLEKLLDMMPPTVRKEYGARIQKSFEYFQVLGFAPEASLEAQIKKSVMQEQFQEASKLLKEIAS
ncbi:MAG: BatD family protein, partial [Bdellovibrionia bacterium]